MKSVLLMFASVAAAVLIGCTTCARDCAKKCDCAQKCDCAKKCSCEKCACVQKCAKAPSRPLSPSCRTSSKLPYKLGVARYTLHKQKFCRALEMLQDMDVHYMGLMEGSIQYDASDAEIAAYKAKAAKFGVEVVSAGPLYYDTEAELKACCEFAKRYGMKYISVVPFEQNPKWKEGMPGRERRLESDKMMDLLEKYCREYDLRAAVHNHGPDNAFLYPTAESALKRIGNRDKRIGVCLDVGHERRAGLDPVEFIRKNGDRVVEVHLKNIKIDPVKNYAKEGPRGELDIPGILKALAEVGYAGVCHIEYEKDFEQLEVPLAESIGYYRGVMDAIKVAPKMMPVPEGANALTEQEKAEGYELLFDGKALPADKWVGVRNNCESFPDKGWFVKDGCLTMRPQHFIGDDGSWGDLPPEDMKLGGGGDIVTKKTYADFAFKFDFRLTPKANSGVKYFYDEKLNKGTCEEYQVLDAGHPDYTKGKDGNRQVAALYDLIPAPLAEKVVKPVGQWNSGMVVSKGNKVEHWLNGVKVLEYERGSESFRKAVDESKYKTWGVDAAGNSQRWGELKSGRLLLQDHTDSTVSFCNLKVRKL